MWVTGISERTDKVVKEMMNCPNCGAPVNGFKCEYCGTILNNGEKLYFENRQMELWRHLDEARADLMIANLTAYQALQNNYIKCDIRTAVNDGCIMRVF